MKNKFRIFFDCFLPGEDYETVRIRAKLIEKPLTLNYTSPIKRQQNGISKSETKAQRNITEKFKCKRKNCNAEKIVTEKLL